MPSPADPVAIIGGTGALGFGLGLRLGIAGVPVTIGSRDAERAAAAASRLAEQAPNGTFDGRSNDDATGSAPTVFLCVPFRNHAETLNNLKHALEDGQLLVDCTVPLAAAVSGKATRMLGVPQGSAGEQAREMTPAGVGVVSALHSVSAASLSDAGVELSEDVLVCGDDRAAKRAVAELLERIGGLRCVDAGRLEMARICESLTALLISINARYKTHAGVRITDLPESLWPDPSS